MRSRAAGGRRRRDRQVQGCSAGRHRPGLEPRLRYADGPAISDEAGQYLADLPIKMIGEQHVFIPNPPHVSFLGREAGIIPIMEEIKHLEDLKHDRVFFFGVPIRVQRIEASWIRAFAFEPRT